jgi:hypothetical protein
VSHTSSENIAWAAGLFEGEGGVNYISTYGKGSVRKTPTVQVRVNNTDLDVLQRFQAILGGRLTGPYDISKYAPNGGKRKPMYQWCASGWAEFERLYLTLKPWLCSRRLAQFEEAWAQAPPREFWGRKGIDAQRRARTHCRNGHEWTPENTRIRKQARGGRTYRVCRACERASETRRLLTRDSGDQPTSSSARAGAGSRSSQVRP